MTTRHPLIEKAEQHLDCAHALAKLPEEKRPSDAAETYAKHLEAAGNLYLRVAANVRDGVR